mgnify:CR=1 FL=1
MAHEGRRQPQAGQPGRQADQGAREQALRLGLTGYARNLPDGRVEVLACGPVEAVARLRDWLRNGPPLAEVTAIVSEPVPFQPLSGFATH